MHGQDVKVLEVGGHTHTHTTQTNTFTTPYTSSLSLSFLCSSMHTRTRMGRPLVDGVARCIGRNCMWALGMCPRAFVW